MKGLIKTTKTNKLNTNFMYCTSKGKEEEVGVWGRMLYRKPVLLYVSVIPLGWDATLSQGYPQRRIRCYSFIHLDEERHCESKESC